MTQEDKILLLKDLCARLPYMPKIKITYQQRGIKGTDEGNVSCDAIEHIVNDLRNGVITDMQIYLRPMSSMTEEEERKYNSLNAYEVGMFPHTEEAFDWLNANHFDYRGLIPMGLALEAPEGMNKYKGGRTMATINEDYVSYEVSQLLKKKGFDAESPAMLYKKHDNTDGTSEIWTACTQQIAIKWLREVHGIFIAINNDDLDFNWQCYDLINRGSTLDPKILSESYAGYKTYEKAVEAALKYSLENLI